MKKLKRTSAFILAITMALCMSACGNSSDNGSSSENTVSVSGSDGSAGASKSTFTIMTAL